MKGETLKKITNTSKTGLKELPSLPNNEEFNVEITSKESGKKYTVSTNALSSGAELTATHTGEVTGATGLTLDKTSDILLVNVDKVLFEMFLWLLQNSQSYQNQLPIYYQDDRNHNSSHLCYW